jgi:AraC-like DNA-binding protein
MRTRVRELGSHSLCERIAAEGTCRHPNDLGDCSPTGRSVTQVSEARGHFYHCPPVKYAFRSCILDKARASPELIALVVAPLAGLPYWLASNGSCGSRPVYSPGESGLLDNQDSTTTRWLAPLFRERYPKVRLDESKMIVRSGKFVTAGAALRNMDLALWIIRHIIPRLAALTARYLVVDSRPSQSAYILVDHLAHSDPLVERFERWARGRLTRGFSLAAAAEAAGSSKRTLARRMHAVLGKSPLTYFQELRVERAVHLLKTTDKSVGEVATRVGYADGVTLRTLLRRHLGQGIREIRNAV